MSVDKSFMRVDMEDGYGITVNVWHEIPVTPERLAQIATAVEQLKAVLAPSAPSPAKAEAPSVEELKKAIECAAELGGLSDEEHEAALLELEALHSNPAPAPSRAQGVDVERVFSNLIRMGYAYEAANDMRNAIRAALQAQGISTAEGGGQ